MNKSSNIRPLRVKKDKPQAMPAVALELKDVDLGAVIKMGLQDFMFQVGMIAVQEVMQAEVEALAGARYSRLPGKSAHRWGTQEGLIYVSGQKVHIDKPRVVAKGNKRQELELQSYREFSKPDAMNEAIMAKMLAGVSMRDYQGTIDQVLDGHGISRSAVSRRAVKTATKRLEEFYTRRFDDREFVAILIDGICVDDIDNIVALGVDVWGTKCPLGIRQGATENTKVCTELLEDLIGRGLSPDGDYLFILDGAKALSKAVKKLFGDNAVIQRCQVHKRRNVADKLPKEHQTRIDKRLSAAYGMNTLEEAQKALAAVYKELIHLSEPAAASLQEGMEETLTVNRLGLNGALKKKLATTNAIESMFSMARRYKRNVKKWNGSQHVERSLVVAILEAERRFHRVEGYLGLKDLQTKIKTLRATTCNTKAA